MATDARALLAGLRAYHASLVKHLAEVREEYAQVEKTWTRLNQVYAGTAADEFRAGWTRTQNSFKEYTQRGVAIAALLQSRVEALERADRPEGRF